MIRDARKHLLCEKIVSVDFSKELFGLCGQMMGKIMNTVLLCNISTTDLPDKFDATIQNNLDLMPHSADSDFFLSFFPWYSV